MGQRQRHYSRGKKKLIVSCLICHFPHKLVYRCSNCDDEEKIQRGCTGNVEAVVADIDCNCGGVDCCDICRGAGSFPIYRCPIMYAANRETQIIRRFFSLWRVGGKAHWPDGLPAIDQPTAIVTAFSIMECITQSGESRDMKSEMNKGK